MMTLPHITKHSVHESGHSACLFTVHDSHSAPRCPESSLHCLCLTAEIPLFLVCMNLNTVISLPAWAVKNLLACTVDISLDGQGAILARAGWQSCIESCSRHCLRTREQKIVLLQTQPHMIFRPGCSSFRHKTRHCITAVAFSQLFSQLVWSRLVAQYEQ